MVSMLALPVLACDTLLHALGKVFVVQPRRQGAVILHDLLLMLLHLSSLHSLFILLRIVVHHFHSLFYLSLHLFYLDELAHGLQLCNHSSVVYCFLLFLLSSLALFDRRLEHLSVNADVLRVEVREPIETEFLKFLEPIQRGRNIYNHIVMQI